MSHTGLTLYPQLITTISVANTLEVGDIINGVGIPIDSEVLSITDLGGGQWGVLIDQTPLEAAVYATGSHSSYTDPSGGVGSRASWSTSITIERPTVISPMISFSEKVGGWVSFKSFGGMQMGISLANDYYTFHEGKLFLHYSEKQDRNTFYGVFNPSTLDVVLNDDPGSVKVFNTLNYEGSQARVDKFTSKEIDGTTYNDQEYYNLHEKKGWSVESIVTNKEEGYVNGFLEKEGKWFNGINKVVDTSIEKADTSDFTFQGIGVAGSVVSSTGGNGGVDVAGCTNPIAINYDPLATIDDGSCRIKDDDDDDDRVFGCTNPLATNYDPLATDDDGTVGGGGTSEGDGGGSDDRILGCTNPTASNYNATATDDDGSCVFPPPKEKDTKTNFSSSTNNY